jgi:hypothetical protein
LNGIGYSTNEPLDRHSEYTSVHVTSLAIYARPITVERIAPIANHFLVKLISLLVLRDFTADDRRELEYCVDQLDSTSSD